MHNALDQNFRSKYEPMGGLQWIEKKILVYPVK